MPPTDTLLSQLVAHDYDRLILAVALTTAIGLAWRLRGTTRAAAAQEIGLSALGLLACTAIGLTWAGLASVLGVGRELWAAPLDRLVAVTSIVTVGWLAGGRARSLTGARIPSSGWGKLLGGSFAAMLLTYLLWAPRWARVFSAELQSTAARDAVAGVAPLWDASQALLALLVGGAILFGSAQRPRLPLAIIGLLLAGSALDLLNPVGLQATWARLGALAGGLALAGSAAGHGLALQRLTRPAADGRDEGAGASRTPAGYGLRDVLAALHSQTSTLSLLSDRLDQLDERVLHLERGPEDPEPSSEALDASASPEPDRPAEAPATEPTAAEARVPEPAGPAGEPRPVDPPAADLSALGPDALEARLLQYQTVLGYLPLGVLMTDASGRIAYANAAALRLLGRQGAIEGLALAELFERADRLHAGLREAIERTGSLGSPVSIEVEQPPLHVELFGLRPPPEGELAGLLAVLSARKGGGSALAEALVPDLAESLRAPVNSILGYSQLLRKGTALAESQVQRYLERIDANLARMQVMLENVGTVLRAEGPSARSTSAQVDLAASIEQALERARHQLEEKGLQVDPVLDPRLEPFSGQPDVVAQILDNLLLHAARRSPQGGDLRIEAGPLDYGEQPRIGLAIQDRGPAPSAAAGEGRVEVRVEDEGYGLELRMVALLTRLHGGQTSVERHPLGSIARVTLPAKPGA